MKILYLCPDLGIPVLGRKGASVHVRQLIEALKKEGHEVILAAQMLNKSPWETPAEFESPILQVRPASGAAAAVQSFKEFNDLLGVTNSLPGELRRILYNKELESELKRRFENNPPDLIYERASLYATAGVSLARHLNVPLIVEINAPLAMEQAAYRATGFGDLAVQAERWTLTQADAVVVVSSLLGDHVASLGVGRGKIHVMPNGVDRTLFHPAKQDEEVRRKMKLGSGPVLGFVGGLRPWHGVEILPELVKRLCVKHSSLRLMFVGDGPLKGELKRKFKELGLSSHVVFAGQLPHESIPDLIRLFDVALAPYPRSDHAFYFSPLKLFEYMACGVPVVASRLGQIADVLRHGKTGMLCAPGSLIDLATQCNKLLSNAKLRASIGHSAANMVHSRFTWEKNGQRVIELAESLREAKRAERKQ